VRREAHDARFTKEYLSPPLGGLGGKNPGGTRNDWNIIGN